MSTTTRSEKGSEGDWASILDASNLSMKDIIKGLRLEDLCVILKETLEFFGFERMLFDRHLGFIQVVV